MKLSQEEIHLAIDRALTENFNDFASLKHRDIKEYRSWLILAMHDLGMVERKMQKAEEAAYQRENMPVGAEE